MRRGPRLLLGSETWWAFVSGSGPLLCSTGVLASQVPRLHMGLAFRRARPTASARSPFTLNKINAHESRRPASAVHPGEGGGPARCTVKSLGLFFSRSTWYSWPEWFRAFSSVSVDWAHLWSPGLIAELMGDGTTLAGNLAFCGQRQDCRTVSSRFAGFSFSYQPPPQTAYPASWFHTCYLIPLSRTHRENGTPTAPQAVPSTACSRPFPSFSIPHAARAACCAHAQAESLL